MRATIVTLGFLAALAVAQPVTDEEIDPLADYGIETLEWEFPTPEGGAVYVNGTMEQAVAQLGDEYPDVEPFTFADEATTLEKRTNFYGSRFHCNGKKAIPESIRSGIEYLRNLNGKPRNGPGPGNCGRSKKAKTLEGWNSIADGAQYIYNHCLVAPKGKLHSVAGQVYHKTSWSVIVKKAKC